MFKKFGENPIAYAIIFGVIAMLIANTVIFYAEGKDGFLLPILAGAITGALVFFIGQSQINDNNYSKQSTENMELKKEIQKLKSNAKGKDSKKSVAQAFDESSFEGFRNSLSEFEKHVLGHFYRHTGHELSDDLYLADPKLQPNHWLVKIFNEVINEYQSNRPELASASKILRAGDFLIYRVSKHHTDKGSFYHQANKGLNYLLNKYDGDEKRKITDLLIIYNSEKLRDN